MQRHGKLAKNSKTKARKRSARRLFAETLERRMLLTTIQSVEPAANSFTSAGSTDVSATFDQNVTAATDQTFVINTPQGGRLTGADTTVTTSGMTATHDPTGSFFAGERVQATVTSGVTTAGGAANARVWEFRAGVGGGLGTFTNSGQLLGDAAANNISNGIQLGDLDGDGDLDMVVANLNASSRVYLNDGAGVFTDSGQALAASSSREVELGDLDGDGDLDAVIVNNGANTRWTNDGTGILSQSQSFGGNNSWDVALGDLDADGDVDVFVANQAGNANGVYLNDGTGNLSGGASLGNHNSRGVELGDVDGDGDLDAYVVNFDHNSRIWLNSGSGTFTDSGQLLGNHESNGVAMGDLDGDGDLDAIVANQVNADRIWFNDGAGTFTDSGQMLKNVATGNADDRGVDWILGDVDADGDLDGIVGQFNGDAEHVYLNDGAGIFTDSGQRLGGSGIGVGDNTEAIAMGDVDGDGDLDLVVANSQGFNPSLGQTKVFFNNNPANSVSIAVDAENIGEAGGVATITATGSAPAASAVTVSLDITGTATATDDYTLSATEIVIPAGATSASITITAVADTLDEPDETVIVDVSGVTGGTESGVQQLTVTITDDDDPPTVSLALDNATLAENGGTGTVTATLSAASGQDVTVDLATSGTASGADFALSGTQITIAAGSTSGTVSITATDDAVDEPDETVVIDIAAATGATEDGTQQVTATIADDDEPPTVSIAVDSESIEEDGGVATFTVTLSAPATGDNTVDLAVSGTATAGTDYNLSATQVVIPAGSTSGSVTATSIADVQITEGGETIIVDIAAVAGNATEDGVQQATTTIVDDVNGPDVTIAVDNAAIAEAGGTATVTATLANAFSLPITVNLALSGTATNGADYTASSVEIVVPVGSTTGTATITATDDALIEGDETVLVDIESVVNGNNAGAQQTITITDDETPPTVTLAVDNATIAEAGGVATFTATSSAVSEQDVTVQLGVSGTATAGDFVLSATEIVIAAGSTSGAVTVTAVEEGVDDGDQTVILDITNVINGTEDGTQQQTTTIIDDDEAPPIPPGPFPAPNTTTAAGNTDIAFNFEQNVVAATEQTFTVHGSSSIGQLTGGDTTFSVAGAIATHSPTNSFHAGELVHATVTSGVTLAGGAASSHVWQFRTASSGSGQFEDGGTALGTTPAQQVSLGDIDGDGDQDAVLAGSELWLNDGSGAFTISGQNLGGTLGGDGVEFADLDGDGDLDLVGGSRMLINDGNGILTNSQNLGGGSAAVGDLDGDGDLDVMTAVRYAPNRVWLNDGNAQFTNTGQAIGNGSTDAVVLGDFDGDGDLDAFEALNGVANKVWINDGNGAFTDSGLSLGGFRASKDADVGDVDGDGDLDVVVANVYQNIGHRLYLNDGTGVFTESGQAFGAATAQGYRVNLGDMDGDGDLDIVAFQRFGAGTEIWLNDGEGVFTDSGARLTFGGGRRIDGADIADIDGDGDLDLVEANFNPNGARIWFNQNLEPTVSLSIDNATIAEDAGTATVTVTLSEAHTSPVTVDLTTAGTASAGDYTLSSTQVVIATGATSGTVTVTAVQDAVDEPDETVIVEISAVTNGQEAGAQQVTTTILDDDEPIPVPDVTLSVDNAAIAEAAGVATFTANLSVPTTVPVTIDFAVSGTADASDYTVSATQIVVAAGATSGSITVTATQDEVDEPDETVIVDISNVTGGAESGTQQATTTITDDDEPVMPDVTLAVDQASIPEAAGVAVFTITLSEATTAPVTVDVGLTGTADASDYTVSATQVVIAAGATSGTVTVTAVQDEVNEPDETVMVDITNVAGGNESGDQQATTTIVDDDTPPSFRVTSLTATDSGFVIEFNSQLDGSALNMYDTQNAGLGAADVTVSGATSGNVVGSLVIGTNSVEFIKSGDSLGADTYTVTLRSADDGFKDDGGALLDGDGDGAAGGDYSNSFTVAAAPDGARTISLPDFVRGPGQDVNLPADGTTGIPISISDGTNVRAADIRISYDPALLQITGATAPAGGTVVVNTTTPGLAILVYFATTALPAGPSDFINLQATVPTENASANYRAQQVLDVHDVIIGDGNDNEFPAVVDDAFHLNTYFADVSGNGRINASDAAQVARFAALIDSGFAASLNADPIIVGDISGNGRINAADASRVAQFAALIPVPEIPPVPGGILINGVLGPIAPVPEGDDLVQVEAPAEASLGFREYPDTYGVAPTVDDAERESDEVESAVNDALEAELLDDGLLEDLAIDQLGGSN